MDSNGTHFHLILGARDWSACTDDTEPPSSDSEPGTGPDTAPGGVTWNEVTLEETLRPLPYRFAAGVGDREATLEDRRGAARDRYGNWYWIDVARRTIRVKNTGDGRIADFWPATKPSAPPAAPGSFAPTAPPSTTPEPRFAALAVTTHHYLVIGTTEPSGLLVFDLHAGGPPLRLDFPTDFDITPFDMAPTPQGGFVLLDRARRRLFQFDARFTLVAEGSSAAMPQGPLEDFQPQDDSVARRRATAPGGGVDAFALTLSTSPVAVDVAPDGTILVLDDGGGTSDGSLHRYQHGAPRGTPLHIHFSALLTDAPSASTSLVPQDFAFLPASATVDSDRVFIVTNEGNQAFSFALTESGGAPALTLVFEYYPMRLYQGKALVTAGATVWYDHPSGFAPLVEQKRARFAMNGVLTTPPLDGKDPDCVWHRLMLDAHIPDGTAVEVFTRAANSQEELLTLPFTSEPPLHAREVGLELPFVSRAAVGSARTFELLFQKAAGRWLQIRLSLTGNGRATPRLRALRAWYPRFSYLAHYLPAAYREDAISASFLERFLANAEGMLTFVEDRIAGSQALFDVRTAPSDTLPWLANWFGVAVDPAWDDARRRLFIRHAMDFFQYRGTARGLRMALRLALEKCPSERIFTDPDDATSSTVRIVERFRARSAPGVFSGDATEGAGVRFVPKEQRWTPEQRRETLETRYLEAATSAKLDAPADYPIRVPSDATVAAFWRSFSQNTLGFVPVSTDADGDAWQAYLADRYRNVTALNAAYRASFAAFSEVPVPSTLPDDGAPLLDWYEFEQIVQPMRATAHRFRVLIPTSLAGETEEQRQQRLDLATRVVELEKPAHTVCDVRFYYAMFRMGEARLGFDSLIDLGGRAAELMAPFVLGPTHLAEGYLAARPPQDAADRSVLGRDRLRSSNA